MLCDKCFKHINYNNFGDLTYECNILCILCLKKYNESESWYCYITRSYNCKYKNWTYNGKTNNPKRRLRQHNGEICGGAKQTLKTKPNEIYCLIKGFNSNVEAMQAEWRIKKPNKKKRIKNIFRGPDGRIKGLNHILQDTQFTSNSKRKINEMDLTIWLVKDKANLIKKIPNNINLIIVNKIDLTKV